MNNSMNSKPLAVKLEQMNLNLKGGLNLAI